MTNEKAIKFFEEQHKSPAYFISLDEWRDYNDALDMAINALGAINLKDLGYSLGEKPRTDGGMVGRQAVLETVESELIGNLGITEQVITENIVNDVCAKIRQLPSVEPKTGEWIYHDDDDMQYDTYHCSSCKKIFTVDAERFDDIGFVKEDLKYCPNCGSYNGGGVWEN